MRPEAFFLPLGDSQRFCLLHHAAATPVRACVVYAPPFGEELNKSRRMVALQSRALAAAGVQVLLPDLLGCGDSSGDFSDASWEQWVDDLVQACAWVLQRSDAPLWLWGLRTGCLLAAQAAQRLDASAQLLFWSPVAAGRQAVQQFLRLAAAADLANGNAKGVLEALRQQLSKGEEVEIAGYRTSAKLLQPMEQAVLQPGQRASRVLWFDLSTQADAQLSPAAAKTVQAWSEAGHAVQARVVHGPAFWQTAEIEESPELLIATTEAMVQATASQSP